MQILYQDSEIVVCVKPVGISSEDGPDSLPALLRQALGGSIFPLHRLDLNVGGVMVYARSKATAAQLSSIIQAGNMVKEYRAIVHGCPPVQGDWQDLLWKDSHQNKVFVVQRMRRGVKSARLEFQRLSNTEPALVHIRLHTGRSHQIRVQFSTRGYPLLGDHKYGARDNLSAPMLFSCRLTFPYHGTVHTFESFPAWAIP